MHEAGRDRGDAREVTEEVERGAFGCQQATGRPLETGNARARLHRSTIGYMPRDRDRWIHERTGHLGAVETGNYAWLTGNSGDDGAVFGGDHRVRGDVAGKAEIFFKGAP